MITKGDGVKDNSGERKNDFTIQKEFIEISVADNGIGFPEEMGDKIFDPYVTTKQQGTGLGLAIVKKIIDEHNGKIILKNREVGSEVLIKFPLV